MAAIALSHKTSLQLEMLHNILSEDEVSPWSVDASATAYLDRLETALNGNDLPEEFHSRWDAIRQQGHKLWADR